MASFSTFDADFLKGIIINNGIENPILKELGLPFFDEKNFCGECVGCGCHNSYLTTRKPNFRLNLETKEILSDGGTCYEPQVYKVKRTRKTQRYNSYVSWVAVYYTGKTKLIRL